MLSSTFTVLFFVIVRFESIEPLCPSGCKCKLAGYCYECETGYYKLDEECKSCSKGCKDCSSNKTCKTCDIGFYARYDNTNNIVCQSCTKGCKKCSPADVCLECDIGYFGNDDHVCSKCFTGCKTCESHMVCLSCLQEFQLNGTFCQPCRKGYFLSNSGCIPCPDKCAACYSPNECTECKKGFYGNLCDHKCSSGCKDDVCDMIIGNCSCTETHTGQFCNICVPEKFGQYCEFNCPVGCFTCDLNGKCTMCKPGYFGVKCKCSNGCLDNKCDKWTGQCSRCKPFYKWPCAHCEDGKYGRNCEKDCPDKCLSCLSETNCTKCKDGFYGINCNYTCSNGNCSNSCSPGFYGQNCERRCYNNCNLCTSLTECHSCEDGFRGYQCQYKCPENCLNNRCQINQLCVSCIPGFYEEFCNLTCPQNCLDSCNSFGNCNNCKYGYHGNRCSEKCSKRCMEDYCFMNGKCAQCTSGFYGKRCEHTCTLHCKKCKNKTFCDSCENGYFDQNCTKQCGYCKNNTSCNIKTGNCEQCSDGMYGRKCESHECPIHCFDVSCSQESGMCDNGCINGYWGKYCENICARNCLNNTCLEMNGTCSHGCVDGYHGYMCSCPRNCVCSTSGDCSKCVNNTFYGPLCDKECSFSCINRTCHSLTGTCNKVCKQGYFGNKCDRKENQDRITRSLLQPIHIVLLIVSLVILILVAVIMGLFLKTSYITKQKNLVTGNLSDSLTYRQVRRSQELLPSEHENNRRQQDGQRIVYQNLADLGNAAINVCEPPIQESVYVNVGEYASIQTKQVPSIVEGNEDNANEVVEVKESVDEVLYANAEDFLRRRVPINQLREIIENKTEIEYSEEFMNLPDGLIKPFHESQKAENLMKNRYKDVCPYDNRRVILKDRGSDYINASYIDGYKRQKVYIASLGPTVKQMGADFGVFWNMVWQEKVCKIVMLTNLEELGVQKCDKYWPDKDECTMYEDVKVTCQSEEIYACFTVRIFSVEKTEKRILYQMHFTAWPDKSTPRDVHGMIEFWEKLTRIPRFELGPILVHCSAGVGRTGTFLALDILANEGVAEGTLDIFACVRNLREDRVNLVQTVEQYKFLHEALLHLLSSDTSVKALLTSDGAVEHNTQKCTLAVEDIHEMV